jgi:hypothetical protein
MHVDILHTEYDNHMVSFPVTDANGNVSFFYTVTFVLIYFLRFYSSKKWLVLHDFSRIC